IRQVCLLLLESLTVLNVSSSLDSVNADAYAIVFGYQYVVAIIQMFLLLTEIYWYTCIVVFNIVFYFLEIHLMA
ncbi:hypothetical protein L9F63_012892, partial [Diploptera punctata]